MEQSRLQATISHVLSNTLASRSELFLSLVDLRESQMRFISTRPGLKNSARRIAAGVGAVQEIAAIEAVLKSFLETGFTGLAYYDANGREVARAGSFTVAPALTFRLRTPLQSDLLWTDRFVLLARIPIGDAGGPLGTVTAEQPLPVITQWTQQGGNLGETGETALCFARTGGMSCFPQRLSPRAFDQALTGADGKRLPISYALEGKTGLVDTRDYRGQRVVAAYGPVGGLGLGMVVKMDSAELLAPVRKELLTVLVVCALLVAGGAVLLRRLVRPMALKMVRAEEEARRAGVRLQFIADNVPALVSYVDAGERYRFANRTYQQWFGLAPRDMLGRTIEEVWDARRYAEVKPHVERALRGEQVEYESATTGMDGARTLHTTYVPDVGPGGKVRGFFNLGSDISQIAEARKALADARQRLDLALDASRVTVWETDVGTGETVLSEAWAELLERPPGETHTTVAELSALVHPSEIAELKRTSMEVVRGKRDHYAVEHRVRAASGQWKWILSRGQVVERDPATGRALRMMGTNLDINARKVAELRTEQLANYDALTGAANRTLFGDRVSRAIVRNRRAGGRAALMYLDIDRFKGVNDSLGHAAGDVLLKEFAARLRACVRATDTVGRLGGDEFAVLLEDVTRAGTAALVAEKILEAVRAPMNIEGRALGMTTSIGIAEFGAEAGEAEALARRADTALYEAKAAGRDTYRVAG